MSIRVHVTKVSPSENSTTQLQRYVHSMQMRCTHHCFQHGKRASKYMYSIKEAEQDLITL